MGIYLLQTLAYLVVIIVKFRESVGRGQDLSSSLIFYLMTGLYYSIHLYNFKRLEISWYNTESQTSKKYAMMQDFILRLLPKHVALA
jgi:hypothetical protein